MMSEQKDNALYEANPSAIKKMRFLFWLVFIAILIPFAIITKIASQSLALTVFMVLAAVMVMLYNGYRSIIGVKISPDELVIITPFTEECFRWNMLTVRRYPRPFFRMDIIIQGSFLPYMAAYGIRSSGFRNALDTIEELSRRA